VWGCDLSQVLEQAILYTDKNRQGFFLWRRAPQQMLRTHRSLKAYCATLWWRWLVFSFFLVMEQRWNEIDRGKPKYSGENLSQCHFVHYKSHMDWPGIEHGPPRWEAGDWLPEPWHGLTTFGLLFHRSFSKTLAFQEGLYFMVNHIGDEARKSGYCITMTFVF
jgi:hypothetical protein